MKSRTVRIRAITHELLEKMAEELEFGNSELADKLLSDSLVELKERLADLEEMENTDEAGTEDDESTKNPDREDAVVNQDEENGSSEDTTTEDIETESDEREDGSGEV
jgi:hypothetical protein